MSTETMLFDTIVAPATSPGRAALAILRIDGPDAGRIVNTLTSGAKTSPPRRVVLRRFAHEGELIDEATVVRFEAPSSFTGNDLVEITVHGSPVVVESLLRAAVSLGARIAEPGEFTERALLNGRIDLVQAESIADLISSRTSLQAKLSLSNLEGVLSAQARAVREDLLFLISRLEAALDFADEGYTFIEGSETVEVLERSLAAVRGVGASFDRGRATREGITLVILGQPNAGKSSLMNYLCGSDRAIVTATPGTTRDLLRETVEIGGLPVTLTDTAGLRASDDEVERLGVTRARKAAGEADLVIYLVDSSRGIDSVDQAELEALEGHLIVYTKRDLAAPPEGAIAISVKTSEGMEAFLRTLDAEVSERFAVPEGTPAIVNERQRGEIEECAAALEGALLAVRNGMPEEIVTVELYRAANALGALVGAISRQDVLREIFAKFCIGK